MQVEELIKLLSVFSANKTEPLKGVCNHSPYTLGEKYFIRTVTHYYTGRLVAVYPTELVLSDVAWIADTGRFNAALEKGTLSEVEPMPGEVILGRGAIVDVSKWSHDLPREVK